MAMVLLTFQRALRHFPFPRAGSMGSLPHFTVERTRCGSVQGRLKAAEPVQDPRFPACHQAQSPPTSAIWQNVPDLVPGLPSLLPPTRATEATQPALCAMGHMPTLRCLSAAHLPRALPASRARRSSAGPGPSKPLPSRLITIRGRGRECQQHQQTATVEDHTDTRWRPHRHQLLTCQG